MDLTGNGFKAPSIKPASILAHVSSRKTLAQALNADQDRIVLNPLRNTDAYAYGFRVSSNQFFRGLAAQKSYLVEISGDRLSGYAASGDSNDALLKLSGSNYAANDANFIFRGLNASINNRSGGTLGRIEHSLGTQNKSGGTVPNLLGLTITAENYGTVADLFGGLDILLKNEAAVATKEFGLRLRNDNNSIASMVHAAIEISDTGANTGWANLLDLDNASGDMVVEDGAASPDKMGGLKVIMPSGGAGYINVYNGVRA
jgi:hypothetical protein